MRWRRSTARLFVILGAIGCAGSALAACGAAEKPVASPTVITVSPPSYRGVRFGDDVERVRSIFGARQPYNGESGGGDSIGAHRPDFSGSFVEGNPGSRQRPISLSDLGAERYHGASFGLYRGRVYSFLVIDRGARIDAGLGIGAPLANARKRFPKLTCLAGLTYEDRTPMTSACFGRIAPKVWVWFGGNPIASIEISRYRLAA